MGGIIIVVLGAAVILFGKKTLSTATPVDTTHAQDKLDASGTSAATSFTAGPTMAQLTAANPSAGATPIAYDYNSSPLSAADMTAIQQVSTFGIGTE